MRDCVAVARFGRGEIGPDRNTTFAGSLRLYLEVARRGYRRYAAYRGATVAGIFTNTVFGFMRAYVLLALFRARPHVGGYTAQDAVTYVWLTQGMIMAVYLWGYTDIADRIRSGDVVTDLYRPVDFQGYWLAQDLGRALYHVLFRGIPPFLLGALAFHLFLPTQPLTYLLFALSVTFAVTLSFALRFIVNVFAFWLLDYRGVANLISVFWTFFSGFIVPLAIFPPLWRPIVEALPFAGMIQTPIDIFLEKQHGLGILVLVGRQFLWAVLLLLAGRLMLVLAMRKMVVQGG